jgi:hypothetical protein
LRLEQNFFGLPAVRHHFQAKRLKQLPEVFFRD